MSTPSIEQQIRYILGAYGDTASLLSEQEIADALVLYPQDWRLAAAYIAESLSNRAVNDPSSFTLAGVMTVSWASRGASWAATAKRLREAYAEDEANANPLGSLQSRMLKRGTAPVVEEFTRPRRAWRTLDG